MIKKVLLYYPCGKLFQRGEDRSQGEIAHSSATVLRAANDLGYMAAVIRNLPLEVKIRDYMGEGKRQADFVRDLQAFKPDMIVCSMTTATLLEDLKTFTLAKQTLPSLITVAKGAFFFTAEWDQKNSEIFEPMDYALIGECETIIDRLIIALNEKKDLSGVKGILRKNGSTYFSNGPAEFVKDLDKIPFPARDLMNNNLYLRPDTHEPQATIQIDRGCPFECTYCLSPIISGKTIRSRSAENILEEIEICVRRYGIKNFFFKSDTFTANRKLVQELCHKIIEKKLQIEWVANSRVKPIDAEMLKLMKAAGCWLIALGIESGSAESLERMKKGVTVEDAIHAVQCARKANLRIYGFFMFGFPWETRQHLEETLRLAKQLKLDYYEFHICVFYPGTSLYSEAMREGSLEKSFSPMGYNYFTNPSGTKHLSRSTLLRMRKKALMAVYLSPSYLLTRLIKMRNLRELIYCFRYGIRFILNLYRMR